MPLHNYRSHTLRKPSDYPRHPQPYLPSGDVLPKPPTSSVQNSSSDNGPVRPFMKSTTSGPPPWGDTHRGGGVPSTHSSEEFPSLPAPPKPTGPSLMLSPDDYVDDFDYPLNDPFIQEDSGRFHPTAQYAFPLPSSCIGC